MLGCAGFDMAAGEGLPGRAIEFDDVSRRYGSRWALAKVTFTLDTGRSLMVAGHNGSGKTTLLRIAAGAILPDRGAGSVASAPLSDRLAVRRATALLSHASNTWETLSARENLRVVAAATGAAEGARNVSLVLERVGLDRRAEDPVSSFSAGMRRRLALGRMLLQSPRIVLLDEPWSQLDPEGFALLDELMAEWRRDGVSVVFSTHMVRHGADRADDAILLESGRVRWHGAAGEFPFESGQGRLQ